MQAARKKEEARCASQAQKHCSCWKEAAQFSGQAKQARQLQLQVQATWVQQLARVVITPVHACAAILTPLAFSMATSHHSQHCSGSKHNWGFKLGALLYGDRAAINSTRHCPYCKAATASIC